MTKATQHLVSLATGLVTVGRETHGRHFWHNTNDTYVVFLAEFFLRRSNRTTVDRFLPQLITEFPDFHAFAEADPERVVASARWAGLATRLRRLPEVSRAILSKPKWTAKELIELPYIGRYAAEGIALYAYDEPHFPVDNNVRRVIGRYFALQYEAEILTAVESLLGYLVENGGIDHLKAAHRGALALGWDSCRTRPNCASCPLAACCKSASEFRLTQFVT